ncbi:nuclear transport factor 2 family protein [Myroides odoratus]
MEHQKQKTIIAHYIESYNNFDVQGMIRDLDQNVIFENSTNGKVDLQLIGKDVFEQHAEKVKQYFSTRNQKIVAWQVEKKLIRLDIQYSAVLAIDLSNELKAGDVLELSGKSEFVIEEGKIKSIRDYTTR